MQADVEINKKKEEVKAGMKKQFIETEGKQKLLRNVLQNNTNATVERSRDVVKNFKKDLENRSNQE